MQHEKTMYGLCDCNNFFASCERVFRPELEGRPVVVLSNNDGCVIARSNEAKALGIRMGHPYFQIRDLEKRHNVAVFSSNFNLYGDMSRRVIWTLRRMVPAAEVYSIDEAFLDLRGIETGRLEELGRHISRTVRRNTGIPVSIGIAPTKTLAKIASKLCKEYPKLQGACLMYRPQDIEKVLRKFPIEDVWGIGRKHRRMLQAANVRTAWDFVQRPEAWIRGRMGVTGLRTWKELQGEACIDFESAPPAKQQITVSRSFAHELTQYEEIHTSVAAFASMAAEKLRRQQSLCGEVTVSSGAETWDLKEVNAIKSGWTADIRRFTNKNFKPVYLVQISGGSVTLSNIVVDGLQDEDAIVNGERVQISRAKRKAFLAALNHYMGETI